MCGSCGKVLKVCGLLVCTVFANGEGSRKLEAYRENHQVLVVPVAEHEAGARIRVFHELVHPVAHPLEDLEAYFEAQDEHREHAL